MKEILQYNFLQNTVQSWLIALGIGMLMLTALRIIQSLVIKRIRALTARTQTNFDDFIISTIGRSVMPMLYVLAIYSSMQYLTLSEKANRIAHVVVMVICTFYVLRIISSFIVYIFQRSLVKQDNEQRKKQSRGILLIIQVLIWVAGFLFLIDNLGYNITTLVAGLGIGGIAIALAAQTILGDLFSYLVIFFDKPFQIGDFIIMDDKLGTVEYIGIKTTRIRTLSGEQLVCSNTDLTNSRVHNYKKMKERRVVFSFRVVYGTAAEKIKRIPAMVKQIVGEFTDTRFDRAHFKTFAESSLEFEVVFYVLSPDYNMYMDRQQSINLRIYEQFEQEGISFALPAQRIFMGSSN
ncbi:mechanosensitive ion channel family protein [Pseudobacter ginsenosidimutans]|uniref:Small-conductance mechanosensitive channel n=1 Tax=Pseudobacter ginsenosidimutans TaxID=661488 RepID=A0A4Q7N107_9BACT|nr:mechanosensitive ion channel family protein [Pseudobacter ginsenosidimutans]QEC42891.1 mechanosensitive ion channel family protein [Pseudobacter ginsenosidimutans]RZS74244.1 small-conductance mechanosensitive channel [Pseudobacter ginsenosidimutans]